VICLEAELLARNVRVAREVSVPIHYRERRLDAGLRIDLLVEDVLVVEIKAAERLLPVHEAQLLTYLKLSGRHLGLLINFNVPMIKDGIRRLVRTA
jgi:GxxExxY protein